MIDFILKIFFYLLRYKYDNNREYLNLEIISSINNIIKLGILLFLL